MNIHVHVIHSACIVHYTHSAVYMYLHVHVYTCWAIPTMLVVSFHRVPTSQSLEEASSWTTLSFSGSMFFISHASQSYFTCRMKYRKVDTLLAVYVHYALSSFSHCQHSEQGWSLSWPWSLVWGTCHSVGVHGRSSPRSSCLWPWGTSTLHPGGRVSPWGSQWGRCMAADPGQSQWSPT